MALTFYFDSTTIPSPGCAVMTSVVKEIRRQLKVTLSCLTYWNCLEPIMIIMITDCKIWDRKSSWRRVLRPWTGRDWFIGLSQSLTPNTQTRNWEEQVNKWPQHANDIYTVGNCTMRRARRKHDMIGLSMTTRRKHDMIGLSMTTRQDSNTIWG